MFEPLAGSWHQLRGAQKWDPMRQVEQPSQSRQIIGVRKPIDEDSIGALRNARQVKDGARRSWNRDNGHDRQIERLGDLFQIAGQVALGRTTGPQAGCRAFLPQRPTLRPGFPARTTIDRPKGALTRNRDDDPASP